MSRYFTDNYFRFYDIEISFSIDLKELKQKYYRYSKELHPDFHTTSDLSIQNEMLQLSAYNNKAYNTLRDDQTRLAYIIDIYSEDDEKAKVSQAFLIQMMEINEGLMELEFDTDPAKKLALEKDLDKQLQALEQEKKTLFNYSRPLTPSSDIMKTAKDLYHKQQYINRLKTNLDKY